MRSTASSVRDEILGRQRSGGLDGDAAADRRVDHVVGAERVLEHQAHDLAQLGVDHVERDLAGGIGRDRGARAAGRRADERRRCRARSRARPAGARPPRSPAGSARRRRRRRRPAARAAGSSDGSARARSGQRSQPARPAASRRARRSAQQRDDHGPRVAGTRWHPTSVVQTLRAIHAMFDQDGKVKPAGFTAALAAQRGEGARSRLAGLCRSRAAALAGGSSGEAADGRLLELASRPRVDCLPGRSALAAVGWSGCARRACACRAIARASAGLVRDRRAAQGLGPRPAAGVTWSRSISLDLPAGDRVARATPARAAGPRAAAGPRGLLGRPACRPARPRPPGLGRRRLRPRRRPAAARTAAATRRTGAAARSRRTTLSGGASKPRRRGPASGERGGRRRRRDLGRERHAARQLERDHRRPGRRSQQPEARRPAQPIVRPSLFVRLLSGRAHQAHASPSHGD